MSNSVVFMFSSKCFRVFDLTLRSLIHFDFIFMYGVRECCNFILLHVAFYHQSLKRVSFSILYSCLLVVV